ncbi:MAG: two-component regulator propeller domain-containing protein [Chitinophagaceae bacterium]
MRLLQGKYKKALIYRCITILITIIMGCPVAAQEINLRFKHLGIANGLSQSSVYCLLQDQKGFIWIGTTDGLSRYDGYSFRHFKFAQNNTYSIRSNEIQALHEDAQGNLLVGTSVGLDLFDPTTERFYGIPVQGDEKATFYVKRIFKDSRGIIWIGTGRGLAQYDPVKKILVPLVINKDQPAYPSYAITEDADHVLWFSSGNSIIRYNPATRQQLPLPQPLLQHPAYRKSAVCFLTFNKGNLWIGTERNGTLQLNLQTGQYNQYNAETKPIAVSNDMVRAIGFYDNYTWIGTRNGLYLIDADGKALKHFKVDLNDPFSLSGNSILCFMQDNAGSLWIGSFAGAISIVQPGNNNFSYIGQGTDKDPGLNYPVVSRILEDKTHNLWIATEGGGINYYNRQTGHFNYIHLNPSSQHLVNQETVKTLQQDEKGNLWIGTLEGLFYYETQTGRAQRLLLDSSGNNLYNEMIYGLDYRNGELWIGTKAGLIQRTPEGRITRFRHSKKDSNSIISNDINALLRDRAGGVWIGTESGLSYLPQGQQHFVNYLYEYSSIFNKNAILCIYEDQYDNCWIGTRGSGIKIFNRQQQRFFTLDTAYGLSSNIIHSIIEDRKGNIWVSFNQGIARLELKKNAPPYINSDIQVTNYSVNNGLGANEFSTAACRTANGQILFGGINGIVAFHPEQLVTNKVPPQVAFTDLFIKNIPTGISSQGSPLQQSITYTDRLTLTYDQAYFTLRFAALNYINQATNQYAYMLDGLKDDQQWHYVGNQQTATYTNLDAGDYIFKVKAANNDGVWNEQYTSLHITVLPPIWKTWYAYLLYTIIIGTLLYLFYSYSVKTTRLKNQLLLQQINRAKDEELVQRKLSFFTNISHEIKTPLTLVLAPIEKLLTLVQGREKETEQLEIMQRNGERLLRLTNQLLDFRKFEAGNMPLQVAEGNLTVFIKEILQSFEGYARQQHIDLQLSVETEQDNTWFDADKVEKMVFNLLSNAFKLTPAGGTIRIIINSTALQHIIRVEDNGAGIAARHLDTIFNPFRHYNDTGKTVAGTGIGLAFTKGLVLLHHGTITVNSRQALNGQPGYTCFTITLPADSTAYTKDERRQEILPERAALPQANIADVSGIPPGTDDTALPLMLITEDNAEMLSLLSGHFSSLYRVMIATNGQEGLEKATETLPDIIISDVMMPGMSGTELCRQLKKDQRTSHIPVILLTARSQLNYQIEGLETGADDYVTKPFSLALLEVRVQNLLQSRKQLRERYSRDVTLQPSQVAITPADETFLERLVQFIEEHLTEPTLQVEEMAKAVNMSRTTLYRKIKALTGQSAIEFIRRIRLKRAAQLLERKEYTVNEVAYMTGFSDVDYFRKCFKEEFGKTPRQV